MASNGGDILEVRYSNPDLGDGVFYPKANEGNTLDLGGYRTGDDANMISGDGQPIYQTNLQRGFFEMVVANDMNERNDAFVASQLAASSKETNWTISHINGTVWGVTGKPVGDIQPDTNAATFTLKVSGGIITKIVG